jgi:hypothetical protein
MTRLTRFLDPPAYHDGLDFTLDALTMFRELTIDAQERAIAEGYQPNGEVRVTMPSSFVDTFIVALDEAKRERTRYRRRMWHVSLLLAFLAPAVFAHAGLLLWWALR